jgi:hypothetical protein
MQFKITDLIAPGASKMTAICKNNIVLDLGNKNIITVV